MDYSRQHEYFDASAFKDRAITIIGAGAVGSRIFEALINLGMRNISVYDDDEVEAHNLANQLYVESDIGFAKVDALANWFFVKTEEKDDTHQCKFIPEIIAGDCRDKMGEITFLAVDTMHDREEIHDNSLMMNPKVDLVIETRMAAVHGNIYCFNPMKPSEYKQWLGTLIDDDKAEASLCGTSITVGTTATLIANLAVSQMMQHLLHNMTDEKINIFLEPLAIHCSTWSK
jgi:molybdopterin/thiamine biosynthesis adenylyltransferase